MIGKSVYKVPGGKLLRVTVDRDGETIRTAKISGDFFIYPQDAFDRLEERLKKVKISDVQGIVETELSGAKLYGIEAKSIVKALREAYRGR